MVASFFSNTTWSNPKIHCMHPPASHLPGDLGRSIWGFGQMYGVAVRSISGRVRLEWKNLYSLQCSILITWYRSPLHVYPKSNIVCCIIQNTPKTQREPRLKSIVWPSRSVIRFVSTHHPTISYYWLQPVSLSTKNGISGHSISIGQPTSKDFKYGVSR